MFGAQPSNLKYTEPGQKRKQLDLNLLNNLNLKTKCCQFNCWFTHSCSGLVEFCLKALETEQKLLSQWAAAIYVCKLFTIGITWLRDGFEPTIWSLLSKPTIIIYLLIFSIIRYLTFLTKDFKFERLIC